MLQQRILYKRVLAAEHDILPFVHETNVNVKAHFLFSNYLNKPSVSAGGDFNGSLTEKIPHGPNCIARYMSHVWLPPSGEYLLGHLFWKGEHTFMWHAETKRENVGFWSKSQEMSSFNSVCTKIMKFMQIGCGLN